MKQFLIAFVIAATVMFILVRFVFAQDVPNWSGSLYLPLVSSPHSGPDQQKDVAPKILRVSNIGQAVPQSCFDSLSPAVSASAVCPLPGSYAVLASNTNDTVVFGNGTQAHRDAWGGQSSDELLTPQHVIDDADLITFADDVGGYQRSVGLDKVSGDRWTLVAIPVPNVNAAAVGQLPPVANDIEFGGLLRQAIRESGVGSGPAVQILRTTRFWDPSAFSFVTPEVRDCGEGDYIEFVPIGPMRIATNPIFGTGVLFKGVFNWPADQNCMAPYTYIEVATLMNVPVLKKMVDDVRNSPNQSTWSWNIGDGFERVVTWWGWDYLSFFAIARAEQSNPATSFMWLLMPEDMMHIDCLIQSGQKVCLFENGGTPNVSR